MITDEDDLFFVDLDHCLVRERGEWNDLANEVTARFAGAAMEVSYSGDGLHIIGTGARVAPFGHRCKRPGVELYTRGRFVALTGVGKLGRADVDCSEALLWLIERFDLAPEQAASAPVGGTGPDPEFDASWTDDEILEKMLGAVGSAGAAYGNTVHPRDLWYANESVLARAYPPAKGPRRDGATFDRSSADAALLSHLAFWTGRDGERMNRLFARSALVRPKWDRRDYARRSIGRSISVCKNIYLGRKQSQQSQQSPQSQRIATRVLGLEEQKTLFAGCYYLRNRHAVMTPDGEVVRPEVFRVVYGGREFLMQPDGARPTRNAFEAFTETRFGFRFPQVLDTDFRPRDPSGDVRDDFVNCWVTPEIDEEPGDVSPFLVHVERMLPDPRDRAILLTYMKSLCQNPGVKFQWCPVVQGMEGNGKSMLVRCLQYAVGRRYSYLPKAGQISEKFNEWMINKVFVGVEEIYVAERREVLQALLDMLTNDKIEIRFVGGRKAMADNVSNWMLTTNHKDAIPVNANQRRYAIFYTAQQRAADLAAAGMSDAYFVALYDWLKDRGFARVAHWLRHEPVDPTFDPARTCQRAPETSTSIEAIATTLGRIEQEIVEAAGENRQGFRGGWVSTLAVARLLDEKRLRNIAPRRTAEILESLGYVRVCKSARIIFQENGRPTLWRHGTGAGTVEEYEDAQGYARRS